MKHYSDGSEPIGPRIEAENLVALKSDLRGKDRRERWEGPPCGVDRRIGQRRALLSAAEREALLL